MLNSLKDLGRTLIPKSIFRAAQPHYHGWLALLAHLYYGRPSKGLTVIGVTGTAGKSTVINILAAILNSADLKTGFITTANYFDGVKETVNQHGLSMPGEFMLQRQLRDMKQHGCKFVIIECTSEGLAQNRHLGIKFSGALLTSLSPAHIDSHGNFNNYRAAKAKLFQALSGPRSISGVNLDTEDAEYFVRFSAARKFGVTLRNEPTLKDITVYKPKNVHSQTNLSFTLNETNFQLPLIGQFNVYNAVFAIAFANMLGLELSQCAAALRDFHGVSGRMQAIPNNRGIQIFVDYAPEPAGMLNALQAINQLTHTRIIHVFGSTGGHRDANKRFEFGKISAGLSDIIIITNDDVYDSDPELIAQNVEQGINQTRNKKVATVIKILDRRQAIGEALRQAQKGDIVLITGKGSEQFLVLPHNQRIAWDEPSVVTEELKKL